MIFLVMGAAAFFISGANATCVLIEWKFERRVPFSNAFWCLVNVGVGALCLSCAV